MALLISSNVSFVPEKTLTLTLNLVFPLISKLMICLLCFVIEWRLLGSCP